MNIPDEMNAGPQPLDSIMESSGLKNHDLVAASTAHLTHKEVAKARKGRRLTAHTQRRVAEAFNACTKANGGPALKPSDLFNYTGR